MTLAFGASLRAIRRDREEGIVALVRARGGSAGAYVRGPRGGPRARPCRRRRRSDARRRDRGGVASPAPRCRRRARASRRSFMRWCSRRRWDRWRWRRSAHARAQAATSRFWWCWRCPSCSRPGPRAALAERMARAHLDSGSARRGPGRRGARRARWLHPWRAALAGLAAVVALSLVVVAASVGSWGERGETMIVLEGVAARRAPLTLAHLSLAWGPGVHAVVGSARRRRAATPGARGRTGAPALGSRPGARRQSRGRRRAHAHRVRSAASRRCPRRCACAMSRRWRPSCAARPPRIRWRGWRPLASKRSRRGPCALSRPRKPTQWHWPRR